MMKNWKDADDSHRNYSIANEDLRMWIYLVYK